MFSSERTPLLQSGGSAPTPASARGAAAVEEASLISTSDRRLLFIGLWTLAFTASLDSTIVASECPGSLAPSRRGRGLTPASSASLDFRDRLRLQSDGLVRLVRNGLLALGVVLHAGVVRPRLQSPSFAPARPDKGPCLPSAVGSATYWEGEALPSLLDPSSRPARSCAASRARCESFPPASRRNQSADQLPSTQARTHLIQSLRWTRRRRSDRGLL